MFSFPETGRAWAIIGKTETEDEIYNVVDESAQPVGGFTAFYEHLSKIMVYPEQARKTGIEGKVFVEFVVQKDGRLTDFKVLKGIGAGCDAEALKVIAQVGNWTPGKMNGIPVAQKLVMPVTFKLN
jgi:protein TonB